MKDSLDDDDTTPLNTVVSIPIEEREIKHEKNPNEVCYCILCFIIMFCILLYICITYGQRNLPKGYKIQLF